MNQTEKRALKTYATTNIGMLRNNLKTGVGRGVAAKEENYREVLDYLRLCRIDVKVGDVSDAVAIIKEVLGRELEVQEPPRDNGAARKLAALNADSSGVGAVISNVDVRLDVDQLKHQHPTVIIGNRQKGGGNRFKAQNCTAAWHQANTMAHMAAWANGLGAMAEGQQQFHGQLVPVNGIHYEGFCLMAGAGSMYSFTATRLTIPR